MLKFKTKRVDDEFVLLHGENRALYDLLTAASTFAQYELSKPLTITHIFRTDEEQAELYSHIPEDKRRKSHHQFWNAVDIRSKDFADWEIDQLLRFFNNFSLNKGQLETAIYHKVPGNAFHFHVKYWGQR